MKVTIINKSDSTGGAAIVSRRLMEALRREGIDARMLVVEKLVPSPYIVRAASPTAIRKAFLAERLKIFLANGLNRADLFKADTASDGLPLHNHPLVRQADAIFLNWTNQGMLSLSGLEKILRTGKPVFQTMHDLWAMTGICHHPGVCTGFMHRCGSCPLLGRMKSASDISRSVWEHKRRIYDAYPNLHFVAVSRWLAGKAAASSLLGSRRVDVIHNAFPVEEFPLGQGSTDGSLRIAIGAARLDDPIKGLPILVEATKILREAHPRLADKIELVSFGTLKNEAAADGIAVRHTHLGRISGNRALADLYGSTDAVISTSLYETLPGTLIEGQACGAIPVAFDSGGQSDIITHLHTGYLAQLRPDDLHASAAAIADGIAWAAAQPKSLRPRLRTSVEEHFSSQAIARAWLALLSET